MTMFCEFKRTILPYRYSKKNFVGNSHGVLRFCEVCIRKRHEQRDDDDGEMRDIVVLLLPYCMKSWSRC
jgi:hypothetical protein